ncbi:MAG: hypothetical protein LHV68_01210 [Elusimicrobia bacterium]|nr:hypothetical protein [Candidatus Liberimonas magnetica]
MISKEIKIDKSSFSVISGINKIASDRGSYWKAKSVAERLINIETLRQINYGYDPATTGLQRVFEITKLKRS